MPGAKLNTDLWINEYISPYDIYTHGLVRILVQKQTTFQEMCIADGGPQGKALILDGKWQSCTRDEFLYHEPLVHPACLFHGNPRDVLVLGGGEGATVREALKWNAVQRVVMVDIDGEVVEACKEHLSEMHQGAFEDPRTELVNSHVIGKEMGVIEPKFMASFMIRDHRGEKEKDYLLANYDRKFEELARQSMSKRQNIFLTQNVSSHMAYTSSGIFVKYKLYAVTEEDARKMAETTLEWLDGKAYNAIQKIKNENENLKSEFEKTKERISKISRSFEYYNKIKEASKIIFPVKDKPGFAVNYDNLPSADIQNCVLEYHNMLNMLEIDIAGHEAKIRTLREYMGKGGGETQLRTHQMLIQEEVELAGAMARRQVIITSAQIVNSYLDAIENIIRLEKERKALEKKVANLQQDIQKREKTLSDPPGHMRPVEVFMNRITIHPVQNWDVK